MKILKHYDLVKELLESSKGKEYQDCYYKLIARVWWDEIGQSETMTAREFLLLLRYKKLSHPESIMRVRRKIEEEQKALRGATYADRQREQSTVRKDLGYAY
jgi:hypothetical protein|tara:strand:+ start:2330 stop:2635 length:306 start_codon:yes stop_codon:yes gene_type:complete